MGKQNGYHRGCGRGTNAARIAQAKFRAELAAKRKHRAEVAERTDGFAPEPARKRS